MAKKILISCVLLLFALVLIIKSGWLSAGAFSQIAQNGGWLFPLISIAALIDSINPCAFSVLLLTIAFLISLGSLRTKILAVGSAYIFGIFLVYILIGLGLLRAFNLFNTPHFLAKLGAIVLIIWGALELIGHYFPNFPIKLKIPNFAHGKMAALMERASLPAAFLLGGVVGLCEFPCTGGPYLMVLTLLHDQATYLKGVWYLLYYNLIFVLPLVLILLIVSNQNTIQKVSDWRKKETGSMRFWSGFAMIGLGLIIFLF